MALHFIADEAGDAQEGGLVTLTGTEAHHAAGVRRVRVGEAVTVGDGEGLWAEGVCEGVDRDEVRIRIASLRREPEPAPRIVLAQALAKGDRAELAVQAATEVGVDEIVPWQAVRSVSRWEGPKVEKARGRWAAIVREAAKQAHRTWVPPVSALVHGTGLAERARTSRTLVLDPAADTPLSAIDLSAPRERGGDLLVVVGPEGGISPEEREALVSAGAEPVRLGSTVLRTSTAGTAALSILSVALGRW